MKKEVTIWLLKHPTMYKNRFYKTISMKKHERFEQSSSGRANEAVRPHLIFSDLVEAAALTLEADKVSSEAFK